MKRVLIKTANTSVLVVDDNEVNLLIAKTTLNQYGISVEAVQSGALALERIAASDYDLIILDCMMPEMSGHETAQRIRALSGSKSKTPIIAYTANNPESVLSEFADVGVSDVLIKPLDTIELTKVLLKYLPNEKLLDKEDVLAELAVIGAAVEVKEVTEKTELQKALEIVPELDYLTGLHFASENEENYYKVICTAVESMRNIAVNVGCFAKSLAFPASDGIVVPGYDTAAFRIDSHSMKGVCACIGLDSLSKLSAQLEKYAIDNADFTTLIEELCDYSNKLADMSSAISIAISKYKDSSIEEDVEIIELSDSEYRSVWDQTAECVRCFEIDEIKNGLTRLYSATQDKDVRLALKKAIEASDIFDYAKVADILKENRPA